MINDASDNFNWIPWFTKSISIPQALFLIDVFKLNWLCWVEATKTSVTLNALSWDFPDSVPAENVVNTESIEESSHMFEALLPPFVIVFCHQLPVVGREAPVLTSFREGIGWSTC